MEHQSVPLCPGCSGQAVGDLLALGDEGGEGRHLLLELVKELKLWSGQRQGVDGALILVAPGESIGDDVLAPRPVLHREGVPEELADPRVLRNRRQPLVQEVLEAAMVSADDERAHPQVRSPVTHRLHKTD